MNYQQHRLYKSHANKVIAGVCSGVGEYLNIDPTLVRIGWILLALWGGTGFILYLIAYFVMPVKPLTAGDEQVEVQHDFTAARVFGIAFVALGIVLLLDNLDLISIHRWWDMSWDFVLPTALVVIGALMLIKREKPVMPKADVGTPPSMPGQSSTEPGAPTQAPGAEIPKPKAIRRSLMDRKLFGVCGGLGEYFEVDPTIVRIAYVIFTILSHGAGVLLYFLMVLLIPEQQFQWQKSQ